MRELRRNPVAGGAVLSGPQPLDWQQIIADIAASGITPYKLALMAGIDKKTLKACMEGRSEPRHSVGAWLLELRAARCDGEKIPS